MNNSLILKYENLIENLKKLDKIVVAFSGGVDSTFLLHSGIKAIGLNCSATIIKTPYIPNWEFNEAKRFCNNNNIKLHIISLEIPDSIKENPKNRCYLCKKILFNKIVEYGKKNNIKHIVDGSNISDLNDFRPGMKALKELKIISPLIEAKLSKNDIREISKNLNLPTWNKPAYACLMTRFPSNTTINNEKLKMVEKAEIILHSNNFKKVRVRIHNDLARIELDKSDITNFIKLDILPIIVEKFKDIGFKYITIDLSGYQMGSFNN